MSAHRTVFRLPVSWDLAVTILERAIQQGRQRFELLDRRNGLMQLKQGDGIGLEVEYRIETASSTLILLTGTCGTLDSLLGKAKRIDGVMRTFQADVEMRIPQTRAAS